MSIWSLHPMRLSSNRPFGTLTYVVGHSRGGTTWLGELIACHPGVRYLFEPFASQAHPCTGIDTQTIFNGGRHIRKRKLGLPVADIPVPRFFREPTSEPNGDLLSRLAATHLSEVAWRAFPDERGYHLVAKQPRIENITWVAAAIAPDHIIALDRHPFGVVNSFRRWGVLHWCDIEWTILAEDRSLGPAARILIEDARTPEERLLVITWLRSLHMRQFAEACTTATLIDYESLCLNPLAETLRLWRSIDLGAGDEEIVALRNLLATRRGGHDRRSRFYNVHKNPLSRVHAWRHELPQAIRRSLENFVRRHGLAIPLPGAGLPELTTAERWTSRCAAPLSLRSHYQQVVAAIRLRLG
jgi:hypothetical protein